MNRAARNIILFISQGAYAGRAPVAPGTAGTVVGVFLYLGMKGLPPGHYLAVCVLVTLVGMWAAGHTEIMLGRTDSPSIVIDEIAGFLIAMFMVPPRWFFIVSGFLLFRVFDIIKPWPLRRLEELHGGPGVMLDDVGAGVYTNIVLQIVALLISR
ncbi:MAG: phosphatidylglycerophosphatase A [Nitrospirae bacterium]|nr:phosphatidylglycerophosphatase A [Nitrospirota bacterium]